MDTRTSPARFPSPRGGKLAARYGPWAVVTGASEGIGRATAAHLAAAGLNVLLVARREAALESLAVELRALGVAARVLSADLGAEDGPPRVIAAARDLDVGLLVAAAGFGTSGAFLASSLEAERAMLAVNCSAVLELCHHFAGRFVERGRGGLVLASSLVAFQGVPRAAHYAATKAWVQSFAEGLRVELAPSGVDVLAFAPGPVRSGFGGRAGMTMGAAATPDEVARGTLAALGKRGTVRPGWLAKLLEAALAPLPRAGRVRVMGLVMAGMTREKA